MNRRLDDATCGIINFNKPAEMTSHDCVSMLRRITGIRRIGHTGTLDPMATGVLPLCIGSAARINEYLDLDTKSYRCTVQLGVTSDTLDIWGTLDTDQREELRREAAQAEGGVDLWMNEMKQKLEEALTSFQGEIFQVPPKYSAVRVDGKRLYEYARKGQEVEIRPRAVYIRQIGLVSFHAEQLQAVFDVECSKGTYIRTICSEIGQLLKCGAAMCGLVRTRSGRFSLDCAISREELEAGRETAEWRTRLLCADFPLTSFGELVLSDNRAAWFVRGGKLAQKDVKVERRPIYHKEEEPHLTDGFQRWMSGRLVEDRFRSAYNVYRSSDHAFLGVAVFSEKERLYRADKIFWKESEQE